MTANLSNQGNILKEVYEKRKPVDQEQGANTPPWLKARKTAVKPKAPDNQATARKNVAARRLAAIRGGK